MSDLIAPVEGASLYAYGHSYLAADFFGANPAQRYINRVAARHRVASLTNRAVPGYRMADAALDALGTSPRSWTPGARGIVVLDCTINDVVQNGDAPAALRGYEHSLRAFCHRLGVEGPAEENSPVVSVCGGRIQAVADFSGGSNWVVGADVTTTATIQVTSPRVVLGFAGIAGPAGRFDILVDGTVVARLDCGSQCMPSQSRTYCPIAVPLTVGDGQHTITVRPADGKPATGVGPFLDYVARPLDFPPAIIVVKGLYVSPQGYAIAPAGASNATVDAYNTVIDRIAGEFPNVIVADPRPGWDPASMVGPDHLHPYAWGQAHIADAVSDALIHVPYSPGTTG